MAVSQAFIVLFIFLCLSVLAVIGCMVRLVLHTKENSISGMIAQRYNPTSYVCIIAIACFSMLTSATVIIGEVESPPGWTTNADETEWTFLPACDSYQSQCSAMVWLNALSPIICMCILFFPLVVVRSDRLLKMRPYVIEKGSQHASKPSHVIVTRRYRRHILSCFGMEWKVQQGDVPDDNIRGVEIEQSDSMDSPSTATAESRPSEIEMVSASFEGAVGGVERSSAEATFPVSIDPTIKKSPATNGGAATRRLVPDDISDEDNGLPLELLPDGKWRVLDKQSELKDNEPQYTAWKAWELVLWPTRCFPTYLYSHFHYMFVGTGIALGWAGLAIYLRFAWEEDDKAWMCCGHSNQRIVARVFVTLLLTLSVVCAVIFTVIGIWLPLYPRTRTLFEGICLLTVDLGIIFAALYGNSLA